MRIEFCQPFNGRLACSGIIAAWLLPRLLKKESMTDTTPKSTMKYAADLKSTFLAADGSMMCEQHPGYEWGCCPVADCAGPGMPWVLSGRTLIEDVIVDARLAAKGMLHHDEE